MADGCGRAAIGSGRAQTWLRKDARHTPAVADVLTSLGHAADQTHGQRHRRPPVQNDAVPAHYRAPGWFTRNVFNRAVAFMTRHGVSLLGSRVLAVRGRTSGEWRTTPVNLLEQDGKRYLVAPRGEAQWVRNLRAAGTGELRVGKRVEEFRARELDADEKVPVLRAYLKRWKVEVGVFFDGTGPDSSDEELRSIASRHPAFEVLAPA
jgi:deazaflavin-dependent oxidoreductase (nitroreductase family)